MPITLKLFFFCIQIIYILSTDYLQVLMYKDYILTICRLSTDYLHIIYRLSTDYLQVLLYKDYILTICRLSTDYLHIIYRLSTDYLHVLLYKDYILTICRLSTGYIICRYYTIEKSIILAFFDHLFLMEKKWFYLYRIDYCSQNG